MSEHNIINTEESNNIASNKSNNDQNNEVKSKTDRVDNQLKYINI